MTSISPKKSNKVNMNGEREEEVGEIGFNIIPEMCIAITISFTSPRDACRFATLSRVFKSAADSDLVWDRFLPSDYHQILARSDYGGMSMNFLTRKQLFMNLADTPLLIDGGMMSFSLEKSSGKKCCTLAASKLAITWVDTPDYWEWYLNYNPKSRFNQVARLIYVWWFEIRGQIAASMLSPNTNYGAYLLYQVTDEVWGFYVPYNVEIETAGGTMVKGRAYLDPRRAGIFEQVFQNVDRDELEVESEEDVKVPKKREDGWLEVEIGEFFNTGEDGDYVNISLFEVEAGITKGGFVVQGVEFRPIN